MTYVGFTDGSESVSAWLSIRTVEAASYVVVSGAELAFGTNWLSFEGPTYS